MDKIEVVWVNINFRNKLLLLLILSTAQVSIFADKLWIQYNGIEIYLYMRIDELKYELGPPEEDILIEEFGDDVRFFQATWPGLEVDYVIHADGPAHSFIQRILVTAPNSSDILGNKIGNTLSSVLDGLKETTDFSQRENLIKVIFNHDYPIDYSSWDSYSYADQRFFTTEFHLSNVEVDGYQNEWAYIQYSQEDGKITEMLIWSEGNGF